MTTRRLRCAGGAGAELAARWDAPDPPDATPPGARAAALVPQFLFAHAFGSSKDLRSTGRIAEALVGAGFGVFRFDFTGVGQSGGSFADTNFTTNVADVLAAAEAMRGEGGAPRFLFGHSLGGAACLRAAREIPECVGVAVLAAPSSVAHLRDVLLARAPRLLEDGEADVETIGKVVHVKAAMLDDFALHDPLADAAALGRALLVVHSTRDTLTRIEHGERIFAAARHPKSFVALDGADHLLMAHDSDARSVGAMLAAWAGATLGARERS